MVKKSACGRSTRHPTVKNDPKPTDPPSPISCGKTERGILKFLIKLNGDRFNVRGFSNQFSVSRSTVYGALLNLVKKGLADKDGYGQHLITDRGRNYLEVIGANRTVCRGADPDIAFVRDHKFTFEIPIRGWPNGWKSGQVAFLNKDEIQKTIQNFSKNNPILRAKFPSDVNVIFTTTKVIIMPKNIFDQDHSDAAAKAITKTYEVITILRDAGFGLDNHNGIMPLIQTEGHYTEVNSLLAQFFEKHARGFKVDGPDGKALFWVDHSKGHREDETATETARERLNRWMYDVMDKDLPRPSEIAEDLHVLKSITADLVKCVASQVYIQQSPPSPPTGKFEARYIG